MSNIKVKIEDTLVVCADCHSAGIGIGLEVREICSDLGLDIVNTTTASSSC